MTRPERALERTALAWNRTGLSFVVVGTAVLRVLAPAGRGLVGIAMVLVGAVASTYAWRPRRERRYAIRLLAFATTAVAIAVFVAAAVPASS